MSDGYAHHFFLAPRAHRHFFYRVKAQAPFPRLGPGPFFLVLVLGRGRLRALLPVLFPVVRPASTNPHPGSVSACLL